MLTIWNNEGTEIRSLPDWARCGLPETRRKQHWKEGRSAFELARAWTGTGKPEAPENLVGLLAPGAARGEIVYERAIVECETPLPFASRGPRCHDLAVWARRGDSLLLICVEAKADESFGATVTEELAKARTRPVTRFPDRLSWLTSGMLGISAFPAGMGGVLNPAIAGIHYQLLSAIAGTLLEAERVGASETVFLIHEFRTHLTRDENMDRNREALNQFLGMFLRAHGCAADPDLKPGQVIGPVTLRSVGCSAGPPFPTGRPLYIAKLRTDCTSPAC